MRREADSHAIRGAVAASPLASVAERELVAAILKRDRKATAEFVELYADSVYAYVRRRLAPRLDVVDDLVQDVFLAAIGGLATFEGVAPLGAWLHGIARHKVEAFYRQQLREPQPLSVFTDEGGDNLAERPQLDEQIDFDRTQAKTKRVLEQLPEPYALALLWRYWEGKSLLEMARETGRTEKGVERLLARARDRFRQMWERS